MCVISEIKYFVANGFRTFRSAACGNYNGESDAVKAIRQEMFSQPSGRAADKMNMRRDRMMVSRDIRFSFNNIVAANG